MTAHSAVLKSPRRPSFFSGIAAVFCKLLPLALQLALHDWQNDASRSSSESHQSCTYQMDLRCMRNACLGLNERAYTSALFIAFQQAHDVLRVGERDFFGVQNCLHAFSVIKKPLLTGMDFQLLFLMMCGKYTMQMLNRGYQIQWKKHFWHA